MPYRLLVLALWLFLTSGSLTQAQTPEPSLVVTVPTRDVATVADTQFFFPLLKLCLDKTQDTHGPYTLQYYPTALSSERIIAHMVDGGPVNTMWTSTSERRERELDFVPISLLGDLSDHRVLLIRAGDQPRFNAVSDLASLRQLKAGIGGHWPDAKLLRNNQIPTVTSIYYASLFKMLVAGRFDYFPRGLFEVKDDLDLYSSGKLAIESGLLLRYPAPFYFFVSPKHPEIRTRIEAGLARAMADGSYQALVSRMPAFVFGQQLLAQPRTVIELVPDYR